MSEIDLRALAAEFPRDQVSWRAQSVSKNGDKALALAFIDARDVMERLDAVCGPENWSDSYDVHQNVTICTISILLPNGWVSKADGAGDTDVEAEKGRISDAFKRAAVKWSVGRYLYALSSPWVPCESYDTGKKDNFGNVKWGWRKWTDDPWNHVRLPRIPVSDTPSSGGGLAATRDAPAAQGGVTSEPHKLTPGQSSALLAKMIADLESQPATYEALDAWKKSEKVVAALQKLLPDDQRLADEALRNARNYVPVNTSVPPDFSKIEQGQDGYEK